ncbi:hypothetical protein BAE44_0026265 [Dichanthelium oligosanthes]|uniref:Embryo surrounding factor 1 brassicaceae domain-containing protein n=1 Tax=Dichanthelium oligosanthes TaxID=888268 RepID=A0A1E5UIL3_9POAL|nr:hypothetical protein BAE44_0026265 [Dichanthelium oligosanthes]
MDAKATAILFAVFLACLLFAAKCNSDDGKRSASGLRRQPVRAEMIGSSKIFVVLCVKSTCGSDYDTCYCCQTLPSRPCFWEQQECWDVCPRQKPQPLPAAPSSSGQQQVPLKATSKSPSPGDNS